MSFNKLQHGGQAMTDSSDSDRFISWLERLAKEAENWPESKKIILGNPKSANNPE